MKGWINMSKKKKNKKENKISKKNIIIIVLAVLVVILVCVVGWFVYRNSLENKTTGSKWSDKYYEFLKSQNNGNKLNWMFTNKSEISFVNSKEIEDPLMLVKNETKCSGNNDNCESVNILGIVDGEVRYFVGTSAKKESVKLYYDIEKKEYKYYLKSTYDNNENYVSLDTIVTDYEKYDLYALVNPETVVQVLQLTALQFLLKKPQIYKPGREMLCLDYGTTLAEAYLALHLQFLEQ